MQVDMHYYGTYAMARAAGLTKAACQVIATAAQFVDDNADDTVKVFSDGSRLDMVATAHTNGQEVQNIDEDNQRRVWVPFHFLPGAEGETLREQLVCRKDSTLARTMLEHHLGQVDQPHGLELIGITAHVYADTFSHFGFAGISSKLNGVNDDSIALDSGLDPDIAAHVSGKLTKFLGKPFAKLLNAFNGVEGGIAAFATASLGHASVGTLPDRPFLTWTFTYSGEEKEPETRTNSTHFLDACRELHGLFERVGANAKAYLDAAAPGVPFGTIAAEVTRIIGMQKTGDDRCKAWQDAAASGALFGGRKETIPPYSDQAWTAELDAIGTSPQPAQLLESHTYRFQKAAAIHRTFVLKDLLPQHGIVIA